MKNRETYNVYQDVNLLKTLAISALFINLFAYLSDKDERKAPIPQKDTVEEHPDLTSIHQLESNSGRNFNHPLVSYGLNRGDRAGGGFGVMPITARETISKNPNLKNRYGHVLNMSNRQITNFLNNNEEASKIIASSHWSRLVKIFPKDRLRRAYAWNCGITCALKASNKEVLSSPYVKKFIKTSKK